MIENIELLAYVRDTISFCRTLVIKYEDLAKLDNALIKSFYKVDPGTDKSKWRYYMNLNGEYHFSDTPMEVKSLDDNTMIAFTKENLELHPATKSAYRLGSYYYTRLVDLYSHQRDLINGIINPIPKEEAIAARDFKILRYTSEYVLWNEIQLIPALQKWIDNLAYQTFSTEYKYTDNLMYGALLVHLLETSVKFVLTARHEARFTRYAHSFYIWSKLQSEGISPSYQSLLNEKQTMWLFRNVEYVMRNLGQEKTFNELMDILLTEREIPLSKYDMTYDTENMPEELVPEAKYITARLNMTDRMGLGVSLREINMTMLKEIPDAIDNDVNYDKMVISTVDDTQFGIASNYPLKILESEMTDTTNRQPETFYHVLNSELIYLAGNDLYDIQIDFTEQLTGNHYTMSVSEAIVVWHHLFFKTMGMQQTNIPEFRYNKALKVTPPTVKELMSLSGGRLLEEDWCTALYKTHIPQFRVISPTKFYENARAIFDLKWAHKKMVARHPAIGYFSRRDNAASTMYETGVVKLTDYKTFDELLERFGLGFETYTKEDCYVMMWEIWQKMTGWNLHDNQTIAQIQSGMIGLMRFMSSYSLQYIKQTDIQSGFFQGGLDMMTDNPMNLRNTGPMPELESEGARIPIPHRVVTHNSLDMSFVGIIEEAGMVVSADMEMRGKIFETPRIWWNEDPDSIWDMKGGHLQVLREATELPWDIEDLIPKGALSPQYTRGLIVDTLIGEMQAGPYRAIGIEIVNNNLDNEIVTYDVSGFPVDQYSEFREEVDSSTSGRNSPKSIGASYVNTKAHYDLGFVPKHVGDGVVKFDLLAQHEDTGEILKLRFSYDVTIDEGTWTNVLEIPETVSLNEEFPVTPSMMGLDLVGGDLTALSYTLANGLDEWLVLRPDSSGGLFGTFKKAGWPKELVALTKATIRPTGQDKENKTGEKYRYMIGYIPSDRYYDPRYDDDFIPKAIYGESDPYALSFETLRVVASKKGWVTKSVVITKSKHNVDNLRGQYGELDDYLAPIQIGELRKTTVDGLEMVNADWRFGVTKLGPKTYDVETTVYNEQTDTTYVLSSTFKTVGYNHDVKYSISTGNSEFIVGVDYPDVMMGISGFKEGTPFDKDKYTFTPLRTLTDSEKVTLTNNGVNIAAGNIGPYGIKFDSKLDKDLSIGHLVPVEVKSKVNTGSINLVSYTQTLFAKEKVFDINDTVLEDFDITGWGELIPWRVNQLTPDRFLFNDNVNGWVLERVQAVTTNHPYKTLIKGPIADYDVPIDLIHVVNGYGKVKDGSDEIPKGKYPVGLGVVPLTDDTLAITYELVFKNKYITGKEKTFNFDVTRPVMKNPITLGLSPTTLARVEDNVIEISRFNDILVPPQYNFLKSDAYVLGITEYTNTTPEYISAENKIKVGKLPLQPTKRSGISIEIMDVYNRAGRDAENSVAGTVTQFVRNGYRDEAIIQIRFPTVESLDLTWEGVDWFRKATSSESFFFKPIDKYGWVVDSIGLDVVGTEEETNWIYRSWQSKTVQPELYQTSVLTTDLPQGKAGRTLTFTPKQLGKQTFMLRVGLKNPDYDGTYNLLVPYEITTTDHGLGLATDPTIWYPIGINTTIPELITGLSETEKTTTILSSYVPTNPDLTSLLSVTRFYNPTVTIKFSKSPEENETPYLAGMLVRKDPKHPQSAPPIYRNGTRLYLVELELNKDQVYNSDNVSWDDFNPVGDILFPERCVDEALVERYSYDEQYRGWKLSDVKVGVTDAHMYNFTFGNETKSIPVLAACPINLDYDYDPDNKPKDGRLFMFPRFGHKVEGAQTTTLTLTIAGTYHSGKKTLTFDLKHNVVDKGITAKLTGKNGPFKVGGTVPMEWQLSGFPQPSLPAWIMGSNSIDMFIGEGSSEFSKTPSSELKISSAYKGKDIFALHYVAYTVYRSGEIPDGHVRSNTEGRYYASGSIITPDELEIDAGLFTLKPSAQELLTNTVCYSRFYMTAPEGWNIGSLSVTGAKEKTTENLVFDFNGEIYPTSFYVEYDYPFLVDIDGVKNIIKNIGFVPKQAGDQQTFPLEFMVDNGNGFSRKVKRDYIVDVKEAPQVTVRIPNVNGHYYKLNELKRETLSFSGMTKRQGGKMEYINTFPLNSPEKSLIAFGYPNLDQGYYNVEFTFLQLNEVDYRFLGFCSEKIQSTDSGTNITDFDGMRVYYGEYSVPKENVYGVPVYSDFELIPDIYAETYQPMEELTDRYKVNNKNKSWTLSDVNVIGTPDGIYYGDVGGVFVPGGSEQIPGQEDGYDYFYLYATPLTTGTVTFSVELTLSNTLTHATTKVSTTLTREVVAQTSFISLDKYRVDDGIETHIKINTVNVPTTRFKDAVFTTDNTDGVVVKPMSALVGDETLSYVNGEIVTKLNQERTGQLGILVLKRYYVSGIPRGDDQRTRKVYYLGDFELDHGPDIPKPVVPTDPTDPETPTSEPGMVPGAFFTVKDYNEVGNYDKIGLNFDTMSQKVINNTCVADDGKTWSLVSVASFGEVGGKVEVFKQKAYGASLLKNAKTGMFDLRVQLLPTDNKSITEMIVMRIVLNIKDEAGNAGQAVTYFRAVPFYDGYGSKAYWMDVNVKARTQSILISEWYTTIKSDPAPDPNIGGSVFVYKESRPLTGENYPNSSLYHDVRYLNNNGRWYFTNIKYPKTIHVWVCEVILVKAARPSGLVNYFYGKIFIYDDVNNIPPERAGKTLYK